MARKGYGFYVDKDIKVDDLDLPILQKTFAENTTSHGVPHIHKAPSIGKKVFWTVLSILSLVALSYHLTNLVTDFIKFEPSTSIVYNSSIRTIDFPAVTLCNNNMVRASAITKELAALISYAENSTDRTSARYELALTLANEYSLIEDLDIKWSLGHQFEDMLMLTQFAYENASNDYEHIFDAVHGNCYTFNYLGLKKPYKVVRSGPENGLWLWLNIEQYEYLPFLTDSAGIKVLVHDRTEAPFPASGGVLVSPNTDTALRIKKTEFSRLGGRYGDCLKKETTAPVTIYEYLYGYPYSKLACQQSCLQREVIQNCTCFMSFIPYDDSFYEQVTPCQLEGIQSDCMNEVYYNYTIGASVCTECKDPCQQNIYDVDLSSTIWPAPTFMDSLQSDLAGFWPYLNATLEKHYPVNPRESFIKTNMLQLQIYYERLSVTQITESPKVTMFEFVANLGGALGLWVGWSMMTIFEFMEYGTDLLAFLMLKCRPKTGDRQPDVRFHGHELPSV